MKILDAAQTLHGGTMAKRGERQWWWADEVRARYVHVDHPKSMLPGGVTYVEFVHEPETRPLQPAELRVAAILENMPRGDLDSLTEKEIVRKVMAKLKTEHNSDKLTRSVFRNAFDYVRDGTLPRRRR
jgi:hypothetical protein